MRFKFIIIVVLIGISTVIFIGFKTPPNELKSIDVSMIHSISKNQTVFKLTEDELVYWKNLKFEIVNSQYPGATPDHIINLIGDKSEFTALYNNESNIVYFSFVPEVKYGFLSNPAPGGWIKPLYKLNNSKEIMELLKIK